MPDQYPAEAEVAPHSGDPRRRVGDARSVGSAEVELPERWNEFLAIRNQLQERRNVLVIGRDVAYIGGLRGERLWRVPLADGSAGEPASFFDGAYGRLRDTIAGEDGGLLIATNETGGSRILRVEMQ